jgi:hypothetical protein
VSVFFQCLFRFNEVHARLQTLESLGLDLFIFELVKFFKDLLDMLFDILLPADKTAGSDSLHALGLIN